MLQVNESSAESFDEQRHYRMPPEPESRHRAWAAGETRQSPHKEINLATFPEIQVVTYRASDYSF